jgi:hypothetical protein
MMALLPATLALAITAVPAGKIALVDLDTSMIGMASQVTLALKEAAVREKRVIVSADELRAKLGSKKYQELIKCSGKPACVAQSLAELPDITRAISGSLAVDEKNYVLRLSLIDLPSLTVVADVDRSILIASRRFQRDVKELAGPLLRGEREARGTLTVKTNARDAQVTVNGELIGVAPVTLQLKPGKHEVKVERPKYLPVTRLVDLEPNQTFTAEIRMILKPGEKVEEEVPALVSKNGESGDGGGFRVRPPTLVAAGAALIAFGVGTVFGIQSSSGDRQLLSGYNKTTDTYLGKRVDAIAVHKNATIANVSFAVAGAAAVVTGVLLFFDIRAGNPALEIAPVASPTGAGVLIGGHF